MDTTSRSDRSAAGGADPCRGRDQPSGSGADRVPGDDASGGVASTGTVVHDGALTSWVRDGTAGSAALRESARAECRPAPFGRSTNRCSTRYPVRPYGPRSGPLAGRRNGPGRCHHRDVSVRQRRRARTRGARVRVVRRPRPGGPSLFRGLLAPDGRAAGRRSRWRPRASHAPSRSSSPSGSTRSSASPSGWPRRTIAQELFRTIVDETMRALRADVTTIRILRDDRLEVAAWAGLSDDVAATPPGLPPRRGLGRRGPAHRPGPGLAGRPRRCASTATSATTASSSSPATSSRRSSTTTGSSARSPRSRASRAPGPTATSRSSRPSRRMPRSRSPTPSSSSRPRPGPPSSASSRRRRPG